MAKKSVEIASGCLSRCADDEPVFVLRAHDVTAPRAVRGWVSNALASVRPPKAEKLAEALRLADEMEAWQNANGVKVPD